MLTKRPPSGIITLVPSERATAQRQGRNEYGGIAQLGERLNGIQEVSGSIPLISTKTWNLRISGLFLYPYLILRNRCFLATVLLISLLSIIIPRIIIISSITFQRERKLLILLPNVLILQKGCKCARKSAMLGVTRGIARLALPISCGKRQPTTKRGI